MPCGAGHRPGRGHSLKVETRVQIPLGLQRRNRRSEHFLKSKRGSARANPPPGPANIPHESQLSPCSATNEDRCGLSFPRPGRRRNGCRSRRESSPARSRSPPHLPATARPESRPRRTRHRTCTNRLRGATSAGPGAEGGDALHEREVDENLQLYPALGYAETGRRTDEGFEASLLQQAPRGIDWYEMMHRKASRKDPPQMRPAAPIRPPRRSAVRVG